MKNIIFILFFLYSSTIQSQSRSYFYNEKGQFYLDTNLTISKAQYSIWSRAEHNLIAGFSNIKFPPIYLENNIKSKGILIVSFVCDTSDINDVKVLSDSSGYPAFSLCVVEGLQEQGKTIAGRLKARAHDTSSDSILYLGRYYVAFDFMLIDFYEQLKIHKAVPIIKGSIPEIGLRVH